MTQTNSTLTANQKIFSWIIIIITFLLLASTPLPKIATKPNSERTFGFDVGTQTETITRAATCVTVALLSGNITITKITMTEEYVSTITKTITTQYTTGPYLTSGTPHNWIITTITGNTTTQTLTALLR